MLAKLKKILIFSAILCLFSTAYGLEIENTADNPRLVNLTPQQFHALDVMEKRAFKIVYYDDNNMDRIERLELELFGEIQRGTATQRINALKLESGRTSIRGTAMTPMMMDSFQTRYINPYGTGASYKEQVGIIDGLIRLWWPDFYAKVTEYRNYKEANTFKY